MAARSILVAFFAVAAAAGCGRHTELVVEGDLSPAARGELLDLLRLLSLGDGLGIKSEGGSVLVEFEWKLEKEERERLGSLLHRLGRPPVHSVEPEFSLVITDRNAKVLEFLEMDPGIENTFHFTLRPKTGKAATRLFRRYGPAPDRICVWEVEVQGDAPPALYYTRGFAEMPDESDKLARLQAALVDNIVFEVDHEVRVSDPAFEGLARKMLFLEPGKVSLLFDRMKSIHGMHTPRYSEYACLEKILDTASDTLLGLLVVPHLAGKIRGFRFEDRYF